MNLLKSILIDMSFQQSAMINCSFKMNCQVFMKCFLYTVNDYNFYKLLVDVNNFKIRL
jgi:hypothetical protein